MHNAGPATSSCSTPLHSNQLATVCTHEFMMDLHTRSRDRRWVWGTSFGFGFNIATHLRYIYHLYTHTHSHLHTVGDLCTCMFYCLSRFAVNLLPNCRRRRRLSKYRRKSRHERGKRGGADAEAIADWPSGHKTSSRSSSITNNVVNNKFIIFALP